MIYENGKIVSDGKILEGYDVITDGNTITSVEKHTPRVGAVDLGGKYIAPGFIDLHCHGAGGFEFIDADDTSWLTASSIHYEHGTRILYPTVSACDFETMYRALSEAKKIIADCAPTIPGVHLEGPYLAPEMCGAQDTSYITPPKKEDYTVLIREFGDIIARWTYAPERDDGTFLATLRENGIKPSTGHSAAEYDTVRQALSGGNDLVTHLYSCTSTITRHGGFRHLGIIEAAYLLDDLYVEAIADGCHLPPELMRLIVKLKGTDRVVLITDAIRHAALDHIENVKGGTEHVPYIIEDGVAKLADRSAFAGSIATTDRLLKKTVEAGISLADTVKMLTETPARVMGLTGYGRIAPGFAALFTVFDENYIVHSL